MCHILCDGLMRAANFLRDPCFRSVRGNADSLSPAGLNFRVLHYFPAIPRTISATPGTTEGRFIFGDGAVVAVGRRGC
jgi:hypothetical protein